MERPWRSVRARLALDVWVTFTTGGQRGARDSQGPGGETRVRTAAAA